MDSIKLDIDDNTPAIISVFLFILKLSKNITIKLNK